MDPDTTEINGVVKGVHYMHHSGAIYVVDGFSIWSADSSGDDDGKTVVHYTSTSSGKHYSQTVDRFIDKVMVPRFKKV